MQTQVRIDEGLQWCERCKTFGWQTFCGQCGRRYAGGELTWRDCPNKQCGARAASDYCPLCGTEIVSDFLRKMERGEVDWAEESRQAGETVARLRAAGVGLAADQGGTSLVDALNRGFGRG